MGQGLDNSVTSVLGKCVHQHLEKGVGCFLYYGREAAMPAVCTVKQEPHLAWN